MNIRIKVYTAREIFYSQTPKRLFPPRFFDFRSLRKRDCFLLNMFSCVRK